MAKRKYIGSSERCFYAFWRERSADSERKQLYYEAVKRPGDEAGSRFEAGALGGTTGSESAA